MGTTALARVPAIFARSLRAGVGSAVVRGNSTRAAAGRGLRRGGGWALLALSLSLGAPAAAQQSGTQAQPQPQAQAQPHALSEYGGVVPPRGGTPPRAPRAGATTRRARRAPARIITWPGFQPSVSGGGSRFFVQTTQAAVTELRQSEGRVEVVFHDTTIHLANSGRWLETQFFETPVTRARLERRGRDMVLVMHLRAAVTPTVTTGTDAAGYTYTYVDFPAGHYRPDEPVALPQPLPQRDASGAAEVRPTSPESAADYPSDADMRAMDDEAPPQVQ